MLVKVMFEQRVKLFSQWFPNLPETAREFLQRSLAKAFLSLINDVFGDVSTMFQVNPVLPASFLSAEIKSTSRLVKRL